MTFTVNEDYKNATKEQRELMLLKTFLELRKYENKKEAEMFITNYSLKDMLKMSSRALFVMTVDDMTKQSKTKFSNEFDSFYNAILDNWIKLSSELKLTNSLELSNLFTYLLWNGYFSKTKVHTYQIEGRTLLDGFFALDIMNGNGVCLNYSDMLKDFLIRSGINSSVIINYSSGAIRDNNALKLIKRNVNQAKLYTKVGFMFLARLIKKTGNHACTLIEENGKIYIYDPTNLLCAKIDDYETASIIDGTGSIKLKPYFSFCFANSDIEKNTLEKLFDNSSLVSPYNKEDINLAWNNCVALFESNRHLIEDCYDETRSDIEKISNNLAECKKKVKRK